MIVDLLGPQPPAGGKLLYSLKIKIELLKKKKSINKQILLG